MVSCAGGVFYVCVCVCVCWIIRMSHTLTQVCRQTDSRIICMFRIASCQRLEHIKLALLSARIYSYVTSVVCGEECWFVSELFVVYGRTV